MTVVRLTENHISAVSEIEKASIGEHCSESALRLLLGDSALGFVALTDDGEVAAYVGMMTVAGEGQITNVATHPDYRRRGYGAAVLDGLLSFAAQNGLNEIYLEVRSSNEAARALYGTRGFECVGERKGFYRFPAEDAVIMKKCI